MGAEDEDIRKTDKITSCVYVHTHAYMHMCVCLCVHDMKL